jgi:hypothetical protein
MMVPSSPQRRQLSESDESVRGAQRAGDRSKLLTQLLRAGTVDPEEIPMMAAMGDPVAIQWCQDNGQKFEDLTQPSHQSGRLSKRSLFNHLVEHCGTVMYSILFDEVAKVLFRELEANGLVQQADEIKAMLPNLKAYGQQAEKSGLLPTHVQRFRAIMGPISTSRTGEWDDVPRGAVTMSQILDHLIMEGVRGLPPMANYPMWGYLVDYDDFLYAVSKEYISRVYSRVR